MDPQDFPTAFEAAQVDRPQFLALDSRLPRLLTGEALAWPRVAPYPFVRPFLRSGFARLVPEKQRRYYSR